MVFIRHNALDFAAVYWHPSDEVLKGLAAALKGRLGIAMSKTNEIELPVTVPTGKI